MASVRHPNGNPSVSVTDQDDSMEDLLGPFGGPIIATEDQGSQVLLLNLESIFERTTCRRDEKKSLHGKFHQTRNK